MVRTMDEHRLWDVDLFAQFRSVRDALGGDVDAIRQLSHELHPTALQHTGLAVALQMACEDLSRVSTLDIQLFADGDTADLPPEVALCLFRVAQEGLSNAVRHARAATIRLSLRRRTGDVMLLVDDNGVGFVPSSTRTKSGLGLHSMVQRLSLVGGILTIDSTPGNGTKIRALVPLNGGSIG